MSTVIWGVRTALIAGVLLASVAAAPVLAQSTAGRQGGASMTSHQKAAIYKRTKARTAKCKREANRGKLHFTARRAFLRDCLARK
jgi:hypothetical protein